MRLKRIQVVESDFEYSLSHSRVWVLKCVDKSPLLGYWDLKIVYLKIKGEIPMYHCYVMEIRTRIVYSRPPEELKEGSRFLVPFLSLSVLFHYKSLYVLASFVRGSSCLFIKWYLQHQFPYHLRNPEPSPSDPAFYGLNCISLWNRILSSWLYSELFSSGSSVHPLVT